MFQRTPPTINEEVKKLFSQIDKNSEPVFLDVEKISHAIELDCYENVKKQIVKEGGKIQYGWQLWEWPGVMLQAEFHAVWIGKEGNLHDITPKQIKRINKILFLPDSNRVYEGRQIDNIRVPLHDDSLIREFIDNEHKIFLEMNRGELASFHGYIEIGPEMQKIMIRQKELKGILVTKYPINEFL